MTYKLVFHHLLPCLNDFIGAAHQLYHYRGSSRQYGDALMKRREQRILEMEVRRQLRGVHIKKPVKLTYLIAEKDHRRDWDNVLSVAMKFCNDAMTAVQLLPNDTQKWIQAYGEPVLIVDRSNPRIEITIEELEDE